MTPVKASLDLLRSLTDAHVLRALMGSPPVTRAELSTLTGISKPTVSESVRRLEAAGVMRDTGERTSGRGGVGAYYALADAVGCALVVGIAPDAVVAETVDPHGRTVARRTSALCRPAEADEVARVVTTTARDAVTATLPPVRLAVVSAADPVDRSSGRLVQLPDAPFLLGDLSPVEALSGLVAGPVVVDNDVNWAARAERDAATSATTETPMGTTTPMDTFCYLYLGEGLGGAVVADGVVHRGARGVAGEIAHLVTTGPDGEAAPLTEVFARLGLRQPGTTAIDVDAVRMAIDVTTASARATVEALATAVEGVVAAMVALADPEVVVLGGPWGSVPAFVDAVARRVGRGPRPVPVRGASVTHDAPFVGARRSAVE
ncbi:MAG: ROK family transcriptional regulator, partial [Lapillicoccus sp.]